MMERLDDIYVEVELISGSWTVLPDVLQRNGISCKSGIRGGDIRSRVAESGTMTFTLRNDAGCSGGVAHYYTPGHINCLAGWQVGKRVRLILLWRGHRFVVWYGRIIINGITINNNDFFPTVKVTARDYFDSLAIHELNLPAFTTEKRIDEIVPLIISNMPVLPLATEYNTGSTTFGTVFDTISSKTTALTEINKLTLSELGYVYLKVPETLVVEGRGTRATKSVSTLYNTIPITEYMETEGGDDLLTESGDEIILELAWSEIDLGVGQESFNLVFNNAGRNVNLQSGIDYINSLKLRSYPRTYDETDKTLFTLNKVISINQNETITFQGRFTDPSMRAVSVAGYDLVSPVVGTHYNLSSSDSVDNGDLNAYVSLTRTYGANGFEDVISSSYAGTGYITKLIATGKAVYTYEPVDIYEENTTDISIYGKQSWNLDCKYLDDPLIGIDYSVALSEKIIEMKTDIINYVYHANKSFLKMEAFLILSIGDVIKITEDNINISNTYVIHSKDFLIGAGGVVLVSYILRSLVNDIYSFWVLDSATQSQLDETTILGF